MNTSYYANHRKYNIENAVSIASKCPEWFKGREYKKLAPKYWFFKKYKEDRDRDFYIEQYKKEILDKLDARTVYEELGENSVLICWEKSGEFCHRHLVAEWLEREMGIEVAEI